MFCFVSQFEVSLMQFPQKINLEIPGLRMGTWRKRNNYQAVWGWERQLGVLHFLYVFTFSESSYSHPAPHMLPFSMPDVPRCWAPGFRLAPFLCKILLQALRLEHSPLFSISDFPVPPDWLTSLSSISSSIYFIYF